MHKVIQKFSNQSSLYTKSLLSNSRPFSIRLLVKDISALQELIDMKYKMVDCDEEGINLTIQDNFQHNHGYYVGTGAIILNHKDEILLVQEKNGVLAGHWGIPSGLVNHSEYIIDGMIREVKEETNLEVIFKDLFLIRKIELTKFGRPDTYFCMLAELQSQQQVIFCEKELMGFQWINKGDVYNFYLNNKCTAVSQFVFKHFKEMIDKNIDCSAHKKFQIINAEKKRIFQVNR